MAKMNFAKKENKETSVEKSFFKILIVDDEQEVHNITKAVLRNFTFENKSVEILSAFNGQEAIEVLKERARLLRKTVYTQDDEYKSKLPTKNESDDLSKELEYCLELTKTLLKDESISMIPAIREKINLLKETIDCIATCL